MAKKAAKPARQAAKKAVKKSAGEAPRKTARKSRALLANFPVVGIGASAGGLEALEGLFDHMPSDSNMAFVIIQHLAPKHKSIMDALLQKHTGMQVLQIKNRMKVEPNRIYLNPPNRDVAIMSGILHLIEPEERHAVRQPIDSFFRSLAEDRGEKAVCVVLSGTGTDGTLGLKAVKGEGGTTMAQDEKQAKYDSMPRSAVNTGLVDYILPVEKMAGELIRYIRHPYIEGPLKPATPRQQYLEALSKIFLLIRSSTGHDFSGYKQTTIRRRIERRMAVHQLENIKDYLRYLQEDNTEVQTLDKDLLIGVTGFFRDGDAFAALTRKAVTAMLEGKKPEAAVRIWVPGCATGEEAYSIAMIILEAMEKLGKSNPVQVFATDIDAEAVEYARAAEYPDSIAADVSQERLKRFFVRGENSYRIKKHVRDMIVFAVQDLIKDPPFSRLDLVSCRNVLIYMDQVLQKKVLPMFHYTLNEGGLLFLGTSESIGEFADLFAPVDTKWKVFKRKGGTVDREAGHPVMPFYKNLEPRGAEAGRTPAGSDVRHMAEKVILTEYAPPCVLVNEKHEILYFYGRTDLYLSLPTGEPTYNVLRMARDELRYKLSTSLHRAEKEKRTVVSEGMKIRHDGVFTTFDLVVRPLTEPKSLRGLTMVVFEARPASERPSGKAAGKQKARKATGEDPRIAALEQELKSTKEYLQTTVEELETSNEELKSTNEELQSTNEELQSSNEELETSKEEMQSTNEELETVNTELQNKVDELSRANDDLDNLLSSTKIATIFLDTDLRIKRFTPAVTDIFNLIKTDVNRPISDITAKLVDEDLRKDAEEVLGTLGHKEAEVQTSDGTCFRMRILPYRTIENVIDGVVITFAEISELKRAKTAADEARAYAEGIVDTVREPLLVLDGDLRVVSANKSFFKTFRVRREETAGSLVFELGNRQWDIPKLRELLETILPRSSEFDDFIVEHDFPTIGRKKMLLNARRIYQEGKKTLLILLAIEDITGSTDT